MKKYIECCPIDNSIDFETTSYKQAEGYLLKCKTCGQLISQCTKDCFMQTMQEFNDPVGTKPNEKSKKRAFVLHSKRLKLIKNILKKEPRDIKLLDVGCSSGAFLESANKLNFTTFGVEPAPEAAKTAIKNGLNVKIGTLQENNYQSNFFDVVTLFEVIEHIKNPIPLLKEINRVLKKNGICVIGTGNTDSLTVKILKSNWEYFNMQKHGGHISFFNPNTIKILATNTKFRVHKIITKNVKLTDNDSLLQHTSIACSDSTPDVGVGSDLSCKSCKPCNNFNICSFNLNYFVHRILKLFAEIIKLPVKFLNKGHDMLAILQKL